jgi:hypothetical protein
VWRKTGDNNERAACQMCRGGNFLSGACVRAGGHDGDRVPLSYDGPIYVVVAKDKLR